MNNVLCSIIIPVYNCEKFIEKTIKSCLSQSLIEHIEIIVIDDCSKDSSYEIVKNLTTLHSNIIVLKNENNLGMNKSINKAASIAKGKYITILGHDDMLRRNHIEFMIEEFNDDTSFVHCNSDLIDKDDNIFGVGVDDKVQIKATENIKYYIALGNVVHSTGQVIRKKNFDEIGGWDEEYRNYGEWIVWIKLISVGKAKYSTRIRALYRKHDTNMTNTFSDRKVSSELVKYYNYCHMHAIGKLDNIVIKSLIKLYLLYMNIKRKIFL